MRGGRGDLRGPRCGVPAARPRHRRPAYYARAEGVLRTPRPRRLATAGDRARPPRLPRCARARPPAGANGAPVLVDALVELGRYDAAGRELQPMVDRKPNLAGYARVSYLRELHGDLDGAVERDAARRRRRRPRSGEHAYVLALLGELERRRGRRAAARRAFRRALRRPRHPGREAGLPDSSGQRPVARSIGAAVVDRLPLPEYVIALGEAELAAGRGARAARPSRWSARSSSC